MIDTTEEWMPVKGFEGVYEVSNLGKVKSLARWCKAGKSVYQINEKILTLSIDKDGYQMVGLSHNGTNHTKKVHRLVANHFIANPTNLPEVNHNDFDRTNNSVSNLKWVSRKENGKYSAVHHAQAYIDRSPIHLRIHEREDILKMHFVYGIETSEIAKIYKRQARTILRICRHRVHNNNHLTL